MMELAELRYNGAGRGGPGRSRGNHMAAVDQLESSMIARPRTARLAVGTIFFVNGVLIANWFARIPDVKQQLGLSEGTLGLALLSAAVGALVAQPTAGWAIGRFGSRVVTSVMVLGFCCAVVILGLTMNFAYLVFALAFWGACNGGLDVAMNAQAALVERQYGRSIMNSFHALWSVGGLAGAGIGGLAASLRVPLAIHFVIGAGVAFGVVLLALRGLVPDGGSGAAHEVAFALPPRALIPMGIVAFSALVSEGAIGDWGAIYLREGLSSSAGLAATGYAVFAGVMAAGRFAGDWLTTRFGSGRLVRASGVLMLVGTGLLVMVGTPWLAIAGFALIGAGVACIFPLIMSAAARTPGVAPGTGIAAMATVGYTGFLVGPPLIGSLAELLSLRGALGLLAICSLMIVLLGRSVEVGDASRE